MSPARFKGKELKEGELIVISVNFTKKSQSVTSQLADTKPQEIAEPIPQEKEPAEAQKPIEKVTSAVEKVGDFASQKIQEFKQNVLPRKEEQEKSSYIDINNFVSERKEQEIIKPSVPQSPSYAPNAEPAIPVVQAPTSPNTPVPSQAPEATVTREMLIPTDRAEDAEFGDKFRKEQNKLITEKSEMIYDPPLLEQIPNQQSNIPIENTPVQLEDTKVYSPKITEDVIPEEITPQLPPVITDKSGTTSKLVMGCLALLFISFIVLLVIAGIMIFQLL